MRDQLKAALALVVVRAARARWRRRGEKEFSGNRLGTPYQAPDVALHRHLRQAVPLAADTDKPLTLVFFGYTHCPDFCPMVLNNIAAGINQLDDADAKRSTWCW